MVNLIESTEDLLNLRNSEKKPIAFVPTMGNLHKGHISLLERALTEYSVVYFSIFVNPKQFAPNEDFNRYPRTLENDLKLIQEAAVRFPNSKVIVYHPKEPSEVFPEGHNQTISVVGLSTDLEGKIRPGHFDGVTTVVYRLFEMIRPGSAYFGLKDYQQYIVIKQLVKDLNLPVNIVGMPIIRDDQGLALSSRNQYLTEEQKKGSLILFNTLTQIKNSIDSQKSKINETKNNIKKYLQDKNWDYIEMRDSDNFSSDLTNAKTITILAVYKMGTTRLLDNMQVEVQ